MHARLRSICSAAFTPRRVEEMRAFIESTANELLDKILSSGRIDMIADFAGPLPAIVIRENAWSAGEDHRQLGAWVIDRRKCWGIFSIIRIV